MALYNQLPDSVKDAGVLKVVTLGPYPPYVVPTSSGGLEGPSIDFINAFGELVGLKVEFTAVAGLGPMITGIQSGRYDFSTNHLADTWERHQTVDIIDTQKDSFAFAVAKDNPKGIKSLDSVCGLRIGTITGTAPEAALKIQSEKCVARGEQPAINLAVPDQATSILAVRSGRSDAVFTSSSPLSYYVKQSSNELELAGVGEDNGGYSNLLQGSIVAQGSAMATVLLQGYEKLFANGTYARVYKGQIPEVNQIEKPGLNLAPQK